jgi:flavin-dependent dehydrogenase
MLDAVIAGAGPAGSLAAIVLARAGARVLLADRETFPRDKLCGDTLNPGALALLASLDLHLDPAAGLPLAGMVISGPRAAVRAAYPGATGLAVRRRYLDAWLLDQAIRAGARFEPGLSATAPLVDESSGLSTVRGLVLRRAGSRAEIRMPAVLSIAADGRRSAIGRGLGLVSLPRAPRRWAFGAYVTGVEGMTSFGEMHVRGGGYVGVAPIGDGLVNVCAVTGRRPVGRTPDQVLHAAIAAETALRDRCRRLELASPISVLGPLALDPVAPGMPGLLLAGDAAGFVDPMTGDGMNLAMRGGVLAAEQALRALESGNLTAAVEGLARARRDAFGTKLVFNRCVRRIVSSPVAVELACWGSRLAPGLVRRAVRYAGDAA